jgi:hypothetical protein
LPCRAKAKVRVKASDPAGAELRAAWVRRASEAAELQCAVRPVDRAAAERREAAEARLVPFPAEEQPRERL